MFDIEFDGTDRFLVIEPNSTASSMLEDLATDAMMRKLSDSDALRVSNLNMALHEAAVLEEAGVLVLIYPRAYSRKLSDSDYITASALLSEWIERLRGGETLEIPF